MEPKSKNQSRRGFTLIELLIVVLILGILTAFAVPAYISSVMTSRQGSANSNARIISTVMQSKGVAAGLYDSNLTDYSADLGGAVPMNPCTGTTTGYVITVTAQIHATVAASVGTNCGPWTPQVFSMSL